MFSAILLEGILAGVIPRWKGQCWAVQKALLVGQLEIPLLEVDRRHAENNIVAIGVMGVVSNYICNDHL